MQPNLYELTVDCFVLDFDRTLGRLFSADAALVACNEVLDVLDLRNKYPEAIDPYFIWGDLRAKIETAPTVELIHLEQRCRALLRKFEIERIEHAKIYHCTKPTLREMKDRGHRIALVSSNEYEVVEAVLTQWGIDGYFETIIARTPDLLLSQLKPHGFPLRRVLADLELDQDQVIYVGDSPEDGACAADAGVRFVGVLSGNTRAVELSTFDPIAIVANVGELLEAPRAR